MDAQKIIILLVDDNLENLDFLSDILQGQGYQVQSLSSGKLAIDKAIASPPDLILLNVMLPDMDSYQVCHDLKNHQKTQNVALIFFGASDELFAQSQVFSFNEIDCITQPFKTQEVLLRVQNQLTIQRLKKQLKQEIQERQCLQFELNIRKRQTQDILPEISVSKDLTTNFKIVEESAIKLRTHNLVLTRLAQNQTLYQGDLKAALNAITETATQNIGVERASIWLYDDKRTKIQCMDLFQASLDRHSEGVCLSAADYPAYFTALQQDQIIAADNAHIDPRTKEFSASYSKLNITSILDTPVRLEGKTVGVLCLEAVGGVHSWTLEDQNFARSLGNLVSLVLEVRSRQRAEAARRASEKKLASAFRSSPDPIALITVPDKRYIEVNDSFCRFFGYSRSQVLHRTDEELNIWVNPEEYNLVTYTLQQTKAIRNHEVDFRISSGEIRTTLFSAEMIDIDGQWYVLGTAKDITERKQAENESRLLLLTTQAITRASDVNNALRVVLRLICQTIGWDFGEAWIPNEDNTVLEHSLGWYAEEDSLEEFCRQSKTVTFGFGVGLPGRVWHKQEPEWIEDVSQVSQPIFLRSLQAAKVGLKAGFGVPILAGNQVLAVLVFFKRSPVLVDRRLLLLVSAVAAQLGGLIERKRVEQELGLANERLQYLLTSSPVVIYSSKTSGDFSTTFISKNVRAMVGYEAAEFIENPNFWLERVHPEDMELVSRKFSRLVEQEYNSYEYRWLHADGTYHWFYEKMRLIRDEADEPIECVGYWADISDRKLAEFAVQEGRQRYQLLAEASPACIFYTDLDGNILYFNQRWSEITGCTVKESLGTGWLNAVHPDDVEKLLIAWNQATISGSNYKHEHRFCHKNGAIVWVICQALPEFAEDGEIKGYIGMITDITERKLAEEALRESAERERAIAQVIQRMRQTLDLETIFAATTQELRQVLNCDRVAVYRFNPNWSGKFISESVADGWISLMEELKNDPHLTQGMIENGRCLMKILDRSDDETQNTYLQDLYGQSASYRCIPDIYNAGLNPAYIKLLERFQAKAYIIVPILSGNQLWGLLASYQNSDLRQWKPEEVNIVVQISNQLAVALQQAQLLAQMQRQSQALQEAAIVADAANRAKSEFLANMSHELRTPLNAILGFTQLMSHDDALSAEHQQNLAIINRAGEHLLNLINDILEMSKIEAGRMTLNLSSFDLIHLLQNLEEMLRFRATSKGLELVFEYTSDLPQVAQADESKLRQVLLNLLGNAIKFTDSGRVMLRVGMGTRDWEASGGKLHKSFSCTQSPIPNPQSLVFEIEDTGCGIAPEEINLLFQAFGQTETGRKSQQGTGLGLAISRKYVQLMGGNISVSSTVGEGSKFSFDIQIGLATVSEVHLKQTRRRVSSLAPGQNQYRILVVDDSTDSRLVLIKILRAIGFVVQEAANGQEAIALWEQWQPHLILMDMRMPIMDGYEATKIIKTREFQRRQNILQCSILHTHTVIIALTAHAFEEQREAMIEAGCDDFINKPFRESELLEKLKEYLGVQYIYQEQTYQIINSNQEIKESMLTLTDLANMISAMSPQWVKQIYNAAAQCSDDLILDLIEEIPLENAALRDFISDLAHNFQFEKIMELTK
ncbi:MULTISPECIES: PAS domain S-box protein [Nostoc]|uniref:histidine kinase n=1 Tax=Nostoc paludosum FACHB-159 TaxID=2692908 RepID=A0ABR8KE39_9NOSO|nr:MULTISPECIES: PAS domain S-box protein [Nostoc]MBD2681670.1 PAS domain S-box protein [Nostoc sp. FACHB-857]MBD2737826.1 PAS domain S-box protein [Nostoc paludosum FACHB-159]